MAKKQRSTQLPEEVFALIDVFEETTGARFNRQVLAALIQFFFGQDPTSPRRWMKLAVGLERGDIALTDIPTIVAQHAVREAEETLGLHLDNLTEDPKDRALRINEARLRLAKNALDNAKHTALHGSIATEPLSNILRSIRGIQVEPDETSETIDPWASHPPPPPDDAPPAPDKE